MRWAFVARKPGFSLAVMWRFSSVEEQEVYCGEDLVHVFQIVVPREAYYGGTKYCNKGLTIDIKKLCRVHLEEVMVLPLFREVVAALSTVDELDSIVLRLGKIAVC